MKNRKTIPNPNKLSKEELEFVQGPSPITSITQEIVKNEKKIGRSYKGYNISMSPSFYNELNQYLKENPTEGARSQFIVRVVAEYIKNKT